MNAGYSCNGAGGLCIAATVDSIFMYPLDAISGSGFLVFYRFSTFSSAKTSYGANTLGQSWKDGPTKQVDGQRPAL